MTAIKCYIEIKCNGYNFFSPHHLDRSALSPDSDSNSRPQNTHECSQSGRLAKNCWMWTLLSSLFFSLSPQNSQSHFPSDSTCIKHKVNKSISTPSILVYQCITSWSTAWLSSVSSSPCCCLAWMMSRKERKWSLPFPRTCCRQPYSRRYLECDCQWLGTKVSYLNFWIIQNFQIRLIWLVLVK